MSAQPSIPTLVAQLRSWLAAHPGEHVPQDIARDMGLPTHTVAARLLYMSDRGQVLRRRLSRARSVYSHPMHSRP